MIEQDFKYFVNSYIIGNLMYFINLKVQANCEECHEGLDFDPSHDCYRIGYKFHERAHLLYYFNDAFFTTLDVLKLELYLLDIQKTISINLLKLGYSKNEIDCINSMDNIWTVVRSEESALWCFDQLWRSHPDKVAQIIIPCLPSEQPLAGNNHLMTEADSVASLSTAQVISGPSDSAASLSTAEAISTALNHVHTGVSYSPDD